MNTLAQATSPRLEATTSIGGEDVYGFRIIKAFVAKDTKVKANRPRSLKESNAWLLKNAARVDAHAKASTKRLIDRDSI